MFVGHFVQTKCESIQIHVYIFVESPKVFVNISKWYSGNIFLIAVTAVIVF